MDSTKSDPKPSEPSPPSSATAQPAAVAPVHPPSPPPSQSGAGAVSAPKISTSTDTPDTTTPPFSPASTTPVLEKEQEDFVGNVQVNDDLPTEKELKKVDDMIVLDSEGRGRPFKELYSNDAAAPRQLIIFIRHFFCGNCQEYLRTLSSSVTPEALLALPTPTFITVIGCGRPDLIRMYAETTGCPFPIYAEPTRKLYDYLGMTRTFDLGKKPSYIQSNLLVTSVQSVFQGIKTGSNALKGGDFKQVGGEFLFEDGKCTWVHRMRNTRDHLEVPELRQIIGLDDAKPPMRKRWSHGIKKIQEKQRSSSWGRGRSKSKSAKDQEGSKTPELREESEVGRLAGRATT